MTCVSCKILSTEKTQCQDLIMDKLVFYHLAGFAPYPETP